jgi:hypothetical protein
MAAVNSPASAIALTIRGHRCRPERGLAAAGRARLWGKSGESLTAHVVKAPAAVGAPLVKKVRRPMVNVALISQGKVAARARFVVCGNA